MLISSGTASVPTLHIVPGECGAVHTAQMEDVPHLDQRRFQDLVSDAKRFLDGRTAGASPIGEDSANGIIEAAALMVDQLLFRLDQLPERVHDALLALVGVQPHPARAARTEVTFWCSAPIEEDLLVPAGTSV